MRKNNRKKILVLGCAIGLILTGCGNQTANTQQTGSTQEIHTTAITGEQKQETETQELTSEEMESLEEPTTSEASTAEADVPTVSETSISETDAQTTEAVNSQATAPSPEFEEVEIEF